MSETTWLQDFKIEGKKRRKKLRAHLFHVIQFLRILGNIFLEVVSRKDKDEDKRKKEKKGHQIISC